MNLQDSISCIKGVGEKKCRILNNMGVETVDDMLHLFPRKYEDRREISYIMEAPFNKDVLVKGRVAARQYRGNPYNKKTPLRILVQDGSADMEVLFVNGRYLADYCNVGCEYTFFGKITLNNGRRQMAHPEFHRLGDKDDERGIFPVYPLTEGITQANMRKIIKSILPLASQAEEWLPDKIAKESNLCSPAYALTNIHFPKDEVQKDMASVRPMNRLIQGDVGSGKTAVAELAIYQTAKAAYQSAMMAPTELLAKQHFVSLKRDLEPLGLNVDLLCSSLKAREKQEVLERLSSGKTDIIVGTHSIIQPEVAFKALGLVITDEQHRFGVNQRSLLAEKGDTPNILVMTATPIPRTLAVILYGDLDISVIDTMPPGRKPVRTYLRNNDSRDNIYDFVHNEVKAGRQAYVVAPLIEESENIDCRSAEEIYKELSQRFPDVSVGLVHGAMKQNEKDSVMESFASGETDILVSTVVIEVGIDVSNATVMVIENCERFGLAQLHQLRGRVGRGKAQSYCILLCGHESEIANKRNKIMCKSSDGFAIAEEDLKLRGPGEIFGTRQHGLPELNISDLIRHVDILEDVKKVAADIIDKDPLICLPEHDQLRRKVKRMFGEKIELKL